PLTRPTRFLECVPPGTPQLQNLRATHQAMSAIWDQVWLRLTPALQRKGPLVRPPQVIHLTAGFEHAAINSAGSERRNLARHDRHHRFIEQRESVRDFALPD